jgi:site-specific DNA-methyltransferase (adenine-specific)
VAGLLRFVNRLGRFVAGLLRFVNRLVRFVAGLLRFVNRLVREGLGMSAIVREVTVGPCRLILGDSLGVISCLDADSVDALITDPPYSSGGMVRSDRTQQTRTKYQTTKVLNEKPLFSGDNRDQRGFFAWCSVWLMMCETVVRPGGAVALFSDWRQLPTTTDAIQSGGFVWRGIVVWDKVNARPMPNRFNCRCEYAVWGTRGPRKFLTNSKSRYLKGLVRCSAPTGIAREHSTQKPVETMSHLVAIADVGETVLDPFMGSGTTGVACIESGRQFIGIEKDSTYFEIAVRRCTEAWERKNSSQVVGALT